MTSEIQTLSGRPARPVSYTYDADGLRGGLVYPSGRAVQLAWTARGQLGSVSADGPPPIATYSYDKAGRPLALALALAHKNGITESKTLDAASQLLANSHLKNGNFAEITDLSGHTAASYRYDAFGNTLVATGSYAVQNRYRFSTKPLNHEVTNAPLYYYGYSYYDPMTGRWPSRDPIDDRRGEFV